MQHRHHIIPKHMGGFDDESNIEMLSVEEHAEAHRLLFEQHGRWEDEIAWKGLAGLIGKDEIVRIVQSNAAKDTNERHGNPWHGTRTKMNWDESPENQLKASLAAQTPEAKVKRKQTMQRNRHQQGSKNSRHGKSLYVSNSERKYFIRGEEPKGWVLRSVELEEQKSKTGAYGRSWYNDGTQNYFLIRDDPLVIEMKLEKRRITA